MKRNACMTCRHVRGIPGDAHMRCGHPAVGDSERDALLALCTGKAAARLKIRANAHGVAKGWCEWPWNFDPCWIDSCDGFEPREDVSGA